MSRFLLTILLVYLLRISAFRTDLHHHKSKFRLNLCNRKVKASFRPPSNVVSPVSPTSVFSTPRTKVPNLRVSESEQPIATHALLMINVFAFLWTARNSKIKMKLLKSNFHIARGDWYRIISALFVHGNVGHLMMNSLSLWNLGPQVESLFGSWKFLALYLISGSIANGATFLLNMSPFSLGSSGSTFGLLGALTGYILRNQQLLGKRSSFLLTGIQRNIIMNILSGFMQPNIDNGAHIGGFAAGLALALILSPKYMITYKAYPSGKLR